MSDKENVLNIDGHELEFRPGETILEVAKRNNIFIPTLCYLKGATPTGACRICVVEVKGARVLLPACATPVTKGMEVRTHSASVLEARRTILSLLLHSGHHNCAISKKDPEDWTEFQAEVLQYDQNEELCPAHSVCKLQAYAYRYQVETERLSSIKPKYPMEMASPLIVRDFSRCILCGRCVDACNSIQVNRAISHGYRGGRAKIVAMGDDSLERSDCVFCGECIQACPVAALVEKKSRYQIRPWEATLVRTTCNYCGVGCQLNLHVKDNKVMKVEGVEDALPNLGRLCVRGRFGYDFVNSPERITQPMIRKNGDLVPASWDEALDLVASKIRGIKEKDGPDAIGAVCSARSTNESLYLAQKLFRAVIGTNNICSPLAGSGMNRPLAELEEADAILMVGCDVTEDNPVAGTFIKRAVVNRECKLIVVNSSPTKIGEFATLDLVVKENSESVLINGLIQELISRGRQAGEELKETASNYSISVVSEHTGLSEEDIKAAADILDAHHPCMLVYGTSVAPMANTFVKLQELLGNLDKKCGGLNYLGSLSNAQGACDMGVQPAFLPGFARVEDGKARKIFEEAWGGSLNPKPGLDFSSLIDSINGKGGNGKGKVRMLYCAGENLAIATPDLPHITEALKQVEFLVVQDILSTETMKYAHVVLPSAAWCEDQGTYTNSERRVSLVRQAVPPIGDSKPETWIYIQLANRLGAQWPEQSSKEVWEQEIIKLVPYLKDIDYAAIQADGKQWTLPEGGQIPLVTPGHIQFNYHHRTLLEQCEGLLESLPRTTRLGTRVPASDPALVTEKFVKFLEEEGLPEKKEQIDEILAAYRDKKGGLIPVLQQVQEIVGYLPVEVQNYIAQGLRIPASDVFGVVTFYSFFSMVPRGRHTVRICLGTACFVKGSAKLAEKLQRHLGVEFGETTEDREYTLEAVRCIGACGLAPVMVIDEVTHGQVQDSEVIEIVESYRGRTIEE